jgi:hypothetical protein
MSVARPGVPVTVGVQPARGSALLVVHRAYAGVPDGFAQAQCPSPSHWLDLPVTRDSKLLCGPIGVTSSPDRERLQVQCRSAETVGFR